MSTPAHAPATPAARGRARRVARALIWSAAAVAALLIVLVASVTVFVGSETGLPYVIRQLTRLTDGRLEIDGAHGSLLSKLQVAELRWRGATTTIVAHDVVVEWQPSALARRELRVNALGASAVELSVAPSSGESASTLPRSLGLPLDVVIEHASVTTFDWALGAREGRVTGIAFGYRGGRQQHRFDDVTLAFERGRISGAVSFAASPPFATAGRIAFAGSDDLAGVEADATLDGVLARLGVTAQGRAGDARFTAHAQMTPFAQAAIDTLDVDATNVDIAAFAPQWPHTSLALGAHATPAAGGFAGRFTLTNAASGRIDASRIPLQSLAAEFAQQGSTITLRDIDAQIAGGGHAAGNATLGLDTRQATATLTLDGVDLNAIDGALVASRIGGRLRATVDADAQLFDGVLADRSRALSLAFAARIAERRVTLSRARLTAAAGTLDGRGQIALDGARAFTLHAHATHFDPSRVGAFPAGALEGEVALRGTLEPSWSVVADATLAPGARLGAQPASGNAHAALAAGVARDVALDLRVGQTHLSASGNAGRPGDALAFAVDSPRLADIAPLLPASARLQDGALHAQGTLAIEPSGIAGQVDARASRLRLADGVAIATLAFHAKVGTPGDPRHPLPLAQRTLEIDAEATGIANPTHALQRARVNAQGSLAAHTLRVELASATDTIAAGAHGALDSARDAPLAWRGTLDSLGVTGTMAIALASPAAVEIAAQRVHIGAAKLAVAGGHVALGDFLLDHGRIATRGAFDGVPLATLAKLAGQPLPVASTLTLQGEWSLAATPRINGTLAVRNERGDIFAGDIDSPSPAAMAIGIRKLTLDARASDDAWTTDATLESLRAGDATAHATLGAGPRPGIPSADAPLTMRLRAALTSLAPFQPWLGTSAVVDGHADLDIAVTGTPRAPVFTGTLAGDGLRIDAPQWGIALSDGTLRASLAQNVVTLDSFAFKGGDGRFTASGTLARASAGGDGAHVTWHADKFRLLNRPDLHIVVSGDGTIATAPQKLALSGKIAVDEGRVVYSPQAALLGDDVVVKGRPQRDAARRSARIPALLLDLDVDLGRAMTFSGEGLETALAGGVHVTTANDGTLDAKGTIRAVRGTYYAFGQQLTIDRGALIFDGPLDNPALDIVALRKNLAVEAGVALTGTVRVPRIQLTSNPPVPDGEKLSWLITGQAPGRGSAADTAALAAASSFLLGGNGRPIGARIAQQFGLDDIAVRSADTGLAGSSSGASGASGQVVAIGKRLSNRLTLVYEQGLTVATNALRLEYALSRTLTLRVEAGTVSGVGIFFRRSYD